MKKYVLVLTAFSPLLALANNSPLPPTLADLASGSACTTYTRNVATYLNNSGKFQDMLNSNWFNDFSAVLGDSSYKEDCINSKCTVLYDGNDHGCYVADVAKSVPIQILFTQLTNAYNTAIQGTTSIGAPGRYGFSGSKGLCTSTNNYQNCQLSIKK